MNAIQGYFTLPGNLHTPKAPLLIMAGALLKDNVTGQVLAQVKYKNLGAKPIKALTVSLQALDTRGLPLGPGGAPVPGSQRSPGQ